jgi:hypothetical protein
MDFTMEKYKEILKAIKISRYKVCTMEEYISSKNKICSDNYIVILRHDVDAKPERALMMADIEDEYGVNSTYYFRAVSGVFDKKIICEIHGKGHEIGYHYEALDIAGGNFEKALKIFKYDLKKFNEICEIKTICMHGNSFTNWDNRDLWTMFDFTSYGISGEAYLSMDFANLIYISDSSRSWKKKYKIKDLYNNMNMLEIKDSDDLIRVIENESYNKIYLLIHPDQWSNKRFDTVMDSLYYSFTNQIKIFYKYINNK